MGTRTVCLGEGLTAAFRGVLDPRRRVAHGYCDLNGEPYRADEYGFAACRTAECFEDAGSVTAAAECWGDVGTASAPLGIGLAAAAWGRGYAPGAVQLVWGSSASGPLRGAALLGAPGFASGEG
jgi:3-oxoacyl-[acyl-carrier-protein] synthase-1